MKALLILAAATLLALPAFAAAASGDCAAARDPGRCEAQRAALKACADKRGAEKYACLDAALPPVDCSKASNPERCETTQKAREVCQSRTGKDLKKCLRDEQPKKKPRHKRQPAPPKN
ncbi:MAG: hypothetical protein HZA62_05010 [Rhodocyclales bacterium]|nr:hypothetical protein [Rhodocyclales bacterium]